MKKLLSIAIFCSLLFTGSNSIAQVGIGTTAPDANAQLDISSTNKGLLIPRMTEAARVGMGTTATNGLLVYQTDVVTGFYFRQNGAWIRLNTSASAIIPYASGNPVSMTTYQALSILPSFVGFGSSAQGLTRAFETINLGEMASSHLAFSVPRAGMIESISAYFSNLSALSERGQFLLTAQLYGSDTPNDVFTAIESAKVTLTLPGVLLAGSTFSGSVTGLNVPVNANTRLLMVYTARLLYPSFDVVTVSGYASGGVAIGGQ